MLVGVMRLGLWVAFETVSDAWSVSGAGSRSFGLIVAVLLFVVRIGMPGLPQLP